MKRQMFQVWGLLLGFLSLWQVSTAVAYAAPGTVVDGVAVKVTAAAHLPEPVRQRMEKSVLAIAEQLIEGQTVSKLQAEQAQYEAIIQQVFDKVLVGYTVRAVQLTMPPVESDVQEQQLTAQVRVDLLPWTARIQAVKLDLKVEGMPPQLEAMLRQDVAGMEDIFSSALQDLPVAATDWTHGLLKKQVEEFLAARAPEFRADFDVDVADVTTVSLTLYPRLPVVRTVDLNMRSDTILNMGLLRIRPRMQTAVDQLIGVPVSFVTRHQAELEQQLADILNEDARYRSFDIQTNVTLTPAEKLTVMSRSNSDTYRVRLEARGDIGNSRGNENDTSLMARAHLGWMMSRRSELFTEVDLYPQATEWQWAFGYRYTLPSGSAAALAYDVRDDFLRVDLEQPLAQKWLVRYAYQEKEHRSEYALRYRLHDFLSLEYVLDSHDSWLRFIGYF